MRSNPTVISVAALSVALAAQAYGGVVSAPFSDSLAIAPGDTGSSFAVVNNRAATGSSTWTAVSGGTVHHYDDGSWGVADAAAYVEVDNLPNDFVVSADVKPIVNAGYAGLTGLVAASSTSSFGGWSSAYYAGYIRLSSQGTAKTTLTVGLSASNPSDYPTGLATVDSILPLTMGTTYSMVFAGDFTATGLDLSFSVTEKGNPSFVPVVATYTVPTAEIFANLGTGFGIRDEVQGGNIDLQYSNFSVANSAVPEPTSMSLLALVGAGLMSRRRKA